MKQKLESRLLGEISITDIEITPRNDKGWQKTRTKESLDGSERGE